MRRARVEFRIAAKLEDASFDVLLGNKTRYYASLSGSELVVKIIMLRTFVICQDVYNTWYTINLL
jgi:hypothetical protein